MADRNEAMSARYTLDFTNTLDGGKAAVITDTVTQCGLYLYSDLDSLAFGMVNQQAERIAKLESAHAIAIEIGAQYAAERDQLRTEVEKLKVALRMGAKAEVARAHEVVGLRAEVESLRSAVNAFCDATIWSAQSWKDQPHIKPLFDHARTTHKDEV